MAGAGVFDRNTRLVEAGARGASAAGVSIGTEATGIDSAAAAVEAGNFGATNVRGRDRSERAWRASAACRALFLIRSAFFASAASRSGEGDEMPITGVSTCATPGDEGVFAYWIESS
jgi:hypothetical protein